MLIYDLTIYDLHIIGQRVICLLILLWGFLRSGDRLLCLLLLV